MTQVSPDSAYPPPPYLYEASQVNPPPMGAPAPNMNINVHMNLLMGMPPPTAPDQWVAAPPTSGFCQPGLEMFELLDTIQVERVFDLRANLTSMLKRVEFKARTSGGLLLYKLAREVTSVDRCQAPTNYVVSVFDENGREACRGVYSGEGCCGGCCSGHMCACVRDKEFTVHIPNGSEVATVEQKCSCMGFKYEVDNLDTMTKWTVCSNGGTRMQVTDDTNGVTLGEIRKVIFYYSDKLVKFKTDTYVVDFAPGLDAKTKAKMFIMSTYLSALYYEIKRDPNQTQGGS